MRRTASRLQRGIIFGVVFLLFGFMIGWASATRFSGRLPANGNIAALWSANQAPGTRPPGDINNEFSVFWEVWNLVEKEFYTQQPLDHTRMVRGAIRGMLAELDDPYTVYQEPDLAAQSQEYLQGTSEGIGASIRIADGKAYIDKPVKGSPAVRAGLQQDDEIIAIDGQDVAALIAGADVNQATTRVAAKVRGPKGSTMSLRIRRGNAAPFQVTIARDAVVISSVKSQMLDNGLAYIQITDFKASTTADFDAALNDLLPHKPRGIILDMRNNPGGYLTPAQEVLGRLYKGVALYEEDGKGALKELKALGSPPSATTFDLPMVVLVNGNSASASEIVAGALRDERPATYLLGEKTFGKGSVQNVQPLSDGGSARITVAHWLTPKRDEINKVGITPQYIVPYNEDPALPVPCVADRAPTTAQSTCADNQLAWAIKLLTTGDTPPMAVAK
jgi:carboxyl-terminal processing protease